MLEKNEFKTGDPSKRCILIRAYELEWVAPAVSILHPFVCAGKLS